MWEGAIESTNCTNQLDGLFYERMNLSRDITFIPSHLLEFLQRYKQKNVEKKMVVSLKMWGCMLLLVLCNSETTWENTVTDITNKAERFYELGDFQNAVETYNDAIKTTPLLKVAELYLKNNLGRLYFSVKHYDDALKTIAPLVNDIEPDIPTFIVAHIFNNVGLSYHYLGQYQRAIDAYDQGIKLSETLNGEILFNAGVSLKRLGQDTEAVNRYHEALEINENMIPALINTAAIYHEHMHIDKAIAMYLSVIDKSQVGASLRLMALTNVGVAYTELGNAPLSIKYFTQAIEEGYKGDTHEYTIKGQIAVAKRTVCNWTDFDSTWIALEKCKVPAAVLPFDSLLSPYSPSFRLELAQSYSKAYVSRPQCYRSINKGPIAVGYMSYDFNDHPTAHLCEELFKFHKINAVVESHILSYGKDDESVFRHRISTAGHVFHDLVLMSHPNIIDKVSKTVDILVDMQGFTRGSKLEVVGARPAAIQVSFLIVPGTSGASFIDYFITDKYISPLAEYHHHFSEKLVVLPNSYQVNSFGSYTRPDLKPTVNRPFTFANFNKLDKLEPMTFQAWMQILHRVPESILLLLEPSRQFKNLTKDQLRLEAMYHGIEPNRLVFVDRVKKQTHLNRQESLADLFIDSLVYGAHSTATDSLWGGLPVLTMAGGSFPNRVGISLLSNVGMEFLVTYSVKEFIDTAVRIAISRVLARALKLHLHKELHRNSPLFDLHKYTGDLETAYQTMVEIHNSKLAPRHFGIL